MWKGVILCHGRRDKIDPQYASLPIKWLTVSLDASSQPDLTASVLDPRLSTVLGKDNDIVVAHHCKIAQDPSKTFELVNGLLRAAKFLLKPGARFDFLGLLPGILKLTPGYEPKVPEVPSNSFFTNYPDKEVVDEVKALLTQLGEQSGYVAWSSINGNDDNIAFTRPLPPKEEKGIQPVPENIHLTPEGLRAGITPADLTNLRLLSARTDGAVFTSKTNPQIVIKNNEDNGTIVYETTVGAIVNEFKSPHIVDTYGSFVCFKLAYGDTSCSAEAVNPIEHIIVEYVPMKTLHAYVEKYQQDLNNRKSGHIYVVDPGQEALPEEDKTWTPVEVPKAPVEQLSIELDRYTSEMFRLCHQVVTLTQQIPKFNHGDLHGENVLYDPVTGNWKLIDLARVHIPNRLLFQGNEGTTYFAGVHDLANRVVRGLCPAIYNPYTAIFVLLQNMFGPHLMVYKGEYSIPSRSGKIIEQMMKLVEVNEHQFVFGHAPDFFQNEFNFGGPVNDIIFTRLNQHVLKEIDPISIPIYNRDENSVGTAEAVVNEWDRLWIKFKQDMGEYKDYDFDYQLRYEPSYDPRYKNEVLAWVRLHIKEICEPVYRYAKFRVDNVYGYTINIAADGTPTRGPKVSQTEWLNFMRNWLQQSIQLLS